MGFAGGRRRWAAAAGAVAVLAAGGVTWKVATAPAQVHAIDQRIPVVDGPKDDQHVTLDTTFFEPVGVKRAPAIMLAHGFGGSKNSTRAQAVKLARDGYAVLTWSARGHGKSTGQITLDNPDYDVKDVRQLIDWLAKRPDVRLDKPGDPRVGLAGESYGGGISLLTAAYDQRVDAIVPLVTWNDLADSLLPDFDGGGAQNGVWKKQWAGIFFTSGSDSGKQGGSVCGRFLPALCTMYQQVAQTGLATPQAVATLRQSSPSQVNDRVRAPTLLIQGQADSLFPLNQADTNAEQIRRNGTPVSVAWIQGGHDGGGTGQDGRIEGLVRGWFDHYLKGRSTGTPAFSVTRPRGFDSSSQQLTLQVARATSYAGIEANPRTLALSGGVQTIHNPAGGTPASMSLMPGLGQLGGLLSASGGGVGQLGAAGQTATFDSARLTAPVQLTGAPQVRIKVAGSVPDGDVVLFATVYDVDQHGTATSAGLVAAPLRVPKAGTAGAEATVTLTARDHRFASGHKVRLVLTSTDMGYATSPAPADYKVSVVSGLSVPAGPALTTPAGTVPWWVWALPVGAVAVAAAILLVRRRSDGGTPSYDEALADVPLEIIGLTKAYKNGQRAVDDLSLRVEAGQVLGLLGPNGAGKTTTLRMLMGLIHPDAGEIRIFGHRVTPGAQVLTRLGSFVEGPGFLPHLSGRDNLELYWRATGRPAADSHADEAVAIADLGSALDRPVRTYSQGMRQRLAIAQAMLGLPDLLVMDEPTNGLDPPQIRAMRDVLVKYAADGRTVIISSHLLSEVEQVCSHVVVMTGGRGVAAGPTAEIVGDGRRLEDAFLAIIGEGA
jgi:ABC-2 type transport system ATP-binding protein